jgi:metal-dependent amidase/aminoacylase/carboxypeptidase family protein
MAPTTSPVAHAGDEPEEGVSAVEAAARAVAAMTLGRIDDETVANIGTVTGGHARKSGRTSWCSRAWLAA